MRVVTPPGGTLVFSAAQLHSTVPNTTSRTRFSIDFRTVNLDDLAEGVGAPNIDSECTGTTLRDFLRASDLEPLPEDVMAAYERPHRGRDSWGAALLMLKTGDVVEVRTPMEILATLDEDASLDRLPFMPEMIQYSGQRFTVSRRVEKICDTVSGSPPYSRRMTDTVFLDDLRCDGSAHGGCQAGCRIYWKESWLRRVDPIPRAVPGRHDAGRDELETLAGQHTRTMREMRRARSRPTAARPRTPCSRARR